MAGSRAERRLAAILAADVVGYSNLIEKDEARTLADLKELRREVIDPLGPGGSGRYLPSLWDAARDRATRAPAQDAPPGAVLVLDGALLLGRWLDLDLTVHLSLRAPTLRRRTPEADHWTLSAFERYATEVDPEATADVVVRADDPARPAIVEH